MLQDYKPSLLAKSAASSRPIFVGKSGVSPQYPTVKVGNYSIPWLLALANSKLLEAAEKHPQDFQQRKRVFCRVVFFNHVGVDVPYGDVNMLLDL